MVKEFFRKTGILLQLFLCLLVVAGIVFYLESSQTPAGRQAPGVTEAADEAENPAETTTLADCFFVSAGTFSAGTSAAQVQHIRLWQDAADQTYYLFLPSYASSAIRLSFGVLGSGFLDGNSCKNGDRITLSAGTHLLESADGQSLSFRVLKSANINTLYTHTDSGSLSWLKASKDHIESGAALLVDADGRTVYSGNLAELSGHGNSSFLGTDKKSYQMKFPEQVDLFGMGSARNWLLVSNAFDPSLLRNYITYDLAREAGLAYSPEAVFVDWYADGEYQGNYLLCEKIEIGKNRVAIADLESDTEAVNQSEELYQFPPLSVGEENARGSYKGFSLQNPSDITGGYLISLELNTDVEPRYSQELSGFVTYRNQAVVIKRPVCASLEQVEYIRDLYQAAEDAIMDESGFNPETGFYYTHYIDVESFALKYIIEELTKNMDAQYSSQFFYKDADSVSKRLYAGPVWDYDRAWGTSGTRVGIDLMDPETFYVNQYTYEGTLWYGLYQQESFRDQIKRSFGKKVLPCLEETLSTRIDTLATKLSDSALMNDYRWQVSGSTEETDRRNSYQEAVASVREFGEKRMEFLKREWCD